MKRLLSIAVPTGLLAGALAAGAAVALVMAGAADAQPGPGAPPMDGPAARFGHVGGGFGLLMFDANNDGKITKAEFDAEQKARFAEADADKDGFVTPEEMRNAMRKRRADMRFARLDADHNGQISRAEFDADQQRENVFYGRRGPLPWGGPPGFARFGGPGGPDGPHGPGMLGPRSGGPAGPAGRAPLPRDGAAPGQPGDQAAAPRIRRMGPADANGDGKLSFEEFSARGNAQFARADADKNGTVTIAELRTAAGAPR